MNYENVLGEVPIQSLNVHHFEMNTNDATVVSSDLQAGVTCYARGQKVTGTGKAFSFATYGAFILNIPVPIPSAINVIEVASTEYPIKTNITFDQIKNIDFSSGQIIGEVTIDGQAYPITVTVSNNLLDISCSRDITLEVFYGKDDYI